MDLFTYLMAKKGHNLSTHGDLFSYLLGKKSQLPSEYQRLEYIESTGTQYIDTGYKPNNNTRVTGNIDINSFGWLFGSRESTNSTEQFVLYISIAGQQRYNYRVGNKEVIQIRTSNIIGNSNFDFSCTNYKITNDVETYTGIISDINTFTGQYNMYLLALNLGGVATTPISAKIYSFKIYDNNKLIRNFIPCLRKSDNEVGLYDTIGGQFYTNQGTGKFAYKGYTFVEYIEGTGTQYIDTGLILTQDNQIEISLMTKKINKLQSIFGSRAGASNNNIACNINADNSLAADFNNSSYSIYRVFYVAELDTKYIIYDSKIKRVIYDENRNILAENNTLCNDTITTPQTATIFYINSQPSQYWEPTSMRLYYCKIWNNNNLIRNFIPCIRNSDNAIGMYDMVNDTFYGNIGTGTFLTPDDVQLNSVQSLNTSLLNENTAETRSIAQSEEPLELDNINEIEEPIEEEVS